jgi:polyhydroxybutyrate depolymerase
MYLFKNRAVVASVIMLALIIGWTGSAEGMLTSGSLEHGGHERTFSYYVPPGYDGQIPVPLVISLHGLGSDAMGQATLSEFAFVAEEEGFIALFPECLELEGEHPNMPDLPGANRQWNIGIDMSLQYAADIDDVGFISALIDHLAAKYTIDRTRVYATGMSNGAMLAFRLAMELPDKIAAIAAVGSPMTVNFAATTPERPITAIIVMGDEDPIVPYEGGSIFMSTEDTVAFWVEANAITAEPEITELPQTAVNDPTLIRRIAYSGGQGGTEVIKYVIEGGGHTWPGGPQFLPAAAIGLVSRHIEASEVIWDDLQRHTLPVERNLVTYLLVGGLAVIVLALGIIYALRAKSQKKSAPVK